MSEQRNPDFLILCLARTGSTHLMDALDSHPQIRCHGEVLNMVHPNAGRGTWFGDSELDDPVEFLRTKLNADPGQKVGFKLPHNSVRDHPAVARWLAQDPEPQVIRLRRKNWLAILTSRRLLRASLVSQANPHDPYHRPTVVINPDECFQALTRIEDDERTLDRLAEGHPIFELEHGELNDGDRLDALQTFLDVEPQELNSGWERRRRKPLSETIENWEEIVRRLQPTRFARLLQED